MDYLYERVSYLKGLADGLGIDEKSKEGKLLLHIVDALEDFADAIDELNENYKNLEQYVEYMDEDLTDVEDEVYDFDDYYLDDDYDDFGDEDDIEDEDYVDVDYGSYDEDLDEIRED